MPTQAMPPPPKQLPAPPATFDAQQWRLKLAGLTDPDSSGDDGNPNAAEHRAAAVDLCLCLCELFGESLDRVTLWDRIASALATAAAKCHDGDTDRFASLALEHVKADPGAATRHEGFCAWMLSCGERPSSWRQGFVRYVVTHSFAALAHGRRAWEQRKTERTAKRNG